MSSYLPLLLSLLLLVAVPVTAVQAGEHAGDEITCRKHNLKIAGEAGPDWCGNQGGICTPEMRGRCGKRRGDWYGARQPVTTVAEARGLLQNYFSGQGFVVSDVSEKKWGFKAEILDKNGNVVDMVMIDKRSGRIRSLN